MTSPKLSYHLHLFGLKRFHGFAILDGRMESIVGLLFSLLIKVSEVLKTFQNLLTITHKKSQILLRTFLISSKPFFEVRKLPRNWLVGAIFKKSVWQTKRGGERKCKGCREDESFSLAIMATDTAFKKSSSGNLFLKKRRSYRHRKRKFMDQET